MVTSKMYKGIEYIQLNDLPADQKEKIKTTLNKDMIIKILVNGELLSDCIQYKDYRAWFQNVYAPARIQVETGQSKNLAPGAEVKFSKQS